MDWIVNNIVLLSGFILSIGIVAYYADKIVILLKEVAEALQVTASAFADNKITKDEIDSITKEWKDAATALQNVLKKDKTQ